MRGAARRPRRSPARSAARRSSTASSSSIVKRGRALVEARGVVILLREGDDLVVAAGAGARAASAIGARVPLGGLDGGPGARPQAAPERIADVGPRAADPARSARASTHALDRAARPARLPRPGPRRARGLRPPRRRTAPSPRDDEQLLRGLRRAARRRPWRTRQVGRGATAGAARSTAAEAERRRWARELHDETLQALGGLRVLLSRARRGSTTPTPCAQPARGDASSSTGDIESLRALITELRPPALDELGLAPALDVARRSAPEPANDVEVRADVELPERPAPGARARDDRLPLVQEALTNVVKHARAASVDIDGALRGRRGGRVRGRRRRRLRRRGRARRRLRPGRHARARRARAAASSACCAAPTPERSSARELPLV